MREKETVTVTFYLPSVEDLNLECSFCGSVVSNVSVHMRWHEQVLMTYLPADKIEDK